MAVPVTLLIMVPAVNVIFFTAASAVAAAVSTAPVTFSPAQVKKSDPAFFPRFTVPASHPSVPDCGRANGAGTLLLSAAVSCW